MHQRFLAGLVSATSSKHFNLKQSVFFSGTLLMGQVGGHRSSGLHVRIAGVATR